MSRGGETLIEGPASKKAKLSPGAGGLTTPRDSMDGAFDYGPAGSSFGVNSLNDCLPDELDMLGHSGSAASTSSANVAFDSAGGHYSLTNGPTALSNGMLAGSPAAAHVFAVSSAAAPSPLRESPFCKSTRAPTGGPASIGSCPSLHAAADLPSPPVYGGQQPASNSSVLQNLLLTKSSAAPVAPHVGMDGSGPRSVPLQHAASPQRPPTAPGVPMNAQYARSPASAHNNIMGSPPNSMCPPSHPRMPMGNGTSRPSGIMPPQGAMMSEGAAASPTFAAMGGGGYAAPMPRVMEARPTPVVGAAFRNDATLAQHERMRAQMSATRNPVMGGPMMARDGAFANNLPAGMRNGPAPPQMQPDMRAMMQHPHMNGMPQPSMEYTHMVPHSPQLPSPQFAAAAQQLRPRVVPGMVQADAPPMSNGPVAPPPFPPSRSPYASFGGAPGGFGGNTPSDGPSAQDPEKRKLIQQQLVLLLHAHKCQQKEHDQGDGRCTLPHCATMKDVLSHMTQCNAGRQCSYAHCASSRQIIYHWKNCQKEDCPVCRPLRNMASNSRQSAEPRNLPMHGANGCDSVAPPSVDSLLFGDNSQIVPPNQVAPGGALRRPPYISPSQRATPPEMKASLGMPESSDVEKSWHMDVTKDLRNHLVGKLVKAIFPQPEPEAMHDHRIKDLIQYARKVEKEMFDTANDREEYYHLLAEKIYKIQKELHDKKTKRLMQQPPQMNGGSVAGYAQMDMLAPPNRTAPPSVGPPGSSLFAASASVKTEPGVPPPPPSTSTRVKDEPAESRPPSAQSRASADGAADAKRPRTAARKIFLPDELRAELMPIWEKLERLDDAIPFRVPVDPTILDIPDYFDIVKQPMDLATIKEKMNLGKYRDPTEFCDDMFLMFENAWLYNRKNSKVYKMCSKLSEAFIDEIDPAMRRLGYCCGQRIAFTPLALFCYGQTQPQPCTIARDSIYFVYEISKTEFNVTVSEKYTYCTKCFDALPDEGINMSDDPSSSTTCDAPVCGRARAAPYSNMVPKKAFKQRKNDTIDLEPLVDCEQCGRKWHTICALHNDKVFPSGFICQNCRHEMNLARPENRFTAKRLPHNALSTHIERRVQGFLERSHCPSNVIIRVLSSSEKTVDVKPQMKSRYCSRGEMPERFPYRAKAIFAFELIDGAEVCFFGLHVQEYGADAQAPNAKRVYIAYLDSVHFFQPREMRTKVYHEILLGYLEYCKQLGYAMAHIWACPPTDGDDYIFHCHPPEQKIPKPKRLQDWYKSMLEQGMLERIVTDFKDIYKQARDDNLREPTSLPYFEGDFWPTVIEDCIRDAESEEAKRREAEAAAAAEPDDADDDLFDIGGVQAKKKNQKSSKKKTPKSKSAQKNKKKAVGGTGNGITDRLYNSMEKHKEVFFTIQLMSAQQSASVVEINDPDPCVTSELMDGRDTFLTKARDEHWEFSSLRRAKYSTMCLCHALHTQGNDQQMIYTCDKCGQNARYHCPICEDYDLCEECSRTTMHKHKLDVIQLLTDDSAAGDQGNAQDQHSRLESIRRCIASLVHVCQCRNINCKKLTCHKMKRVVQHARHCKRRQGGTCQVCKQLIALCCYHAKHCTDNECQVPFCLNIRQKLQEQKTVQRRQGDRLMMRRMNMMFHQQQQPPPPPHADAVAAPPAAQPFGQPLGAQPPHVQQQQTQQRQPIQQQPQMADVAAYNAAREAQQMASRQQQQLNPPPYGRALPPSAAPVAAMTRAPMVNSWPDPAVDAFSPRNPQQFVGMRAQGSRESAVVQQFIQSMRNVSTPVEQKRLMDELRADPQAFSFFLEMRNRGTAQQQQQQQQQMAARNSQQQQQQAAAAAGGWPSQPTAVAMAQAPQQQFYGAGGGGVATQQRPMRPTHFGGGGGAPVAANYQAYRMAAANGRAPLSPAMHGGIGQAGGVLGHVRSPLGRSPSMAAPPQPSPSNGQYR